MGGGGVVTSAMRFRARESITAGKRIKRNPVNTDTNGTCHSVRIIRVSVLSGLSEKTSGTRFIDINTKADSFTRKRCLIS